MENKTLVIIGVIFFLILCMTIGLPAFAIQQSVKNDSITATATPTAKPNQATFDSANVRQIRSFLETAPTVKVIITLKAGQLLQEPYKSDIDQRRTLIRDIQDKFILESSLEKAAISDRQELEPVISMSVDQNSFERILISSQLQDITATNN